MFNWDQVGVAITWFVIAVDKHAKAQALSNDKEWMSKSRASKMLAWIWTMVINASELIPNGMTNDNGDPITDCTTFMDSYQQFLEQPSSGATKQFLDHYLNDKKHCSTNVPLSTCVTLYLGSICWMGIMKPKAFSMLACYHLASSHTMLSMDAAGLHLKSAEGSGLSDADVAKATKVILLLPWSMDMLAKLCTIFAMLLALALGKKAPATTTFLDQCNDFHDNEDSYQMRAAADMTFPLQVAMYLDRSFQLYLSDCVHAMSPDDVLSFQSMWKEIMLGTFQVQNVPSSLLDQLQTQPSGLGSKHLGTMWDDVSDDDEVLLLCKCTNKKWHKKGHQVSNDNLVSLWKMEKDHLGFFVPSLWSALSASTFTWAALATMSAISKLSVKTTWIMGQAEQKNHGRHARTPCLLMRRIQPVTQKPTMLDW